MSKFSATYSAPEYLASYPEYLLQHADCHPLFSGTMQEIADVFRARRSTVCAWCRDHPEFAAAVTQVQESRNDRMAQKLFRVAFGYPYKERKKVQDADGMVIKEEIAEKYLPENVNAIRLWLINRNGHEWKAKPEETVSASVTINLVNNLEEFR